MDEDGAKRVCAKFEVDWISTLPDSLKLEILLNLCTKDVVKTSVLSSSWRTLWRYVPGFDLTHYDFSNHDSFVSFVDSFLGFNEPRLRNLKLLYSSYKYDDHDVACLTQWINTVVERKIQHLELVDEACCIKKVEMPLILYTCESLVSLKLNSQVCSTLATPKFVSLPSLKIMELTSVYCYDMLLETLISGCSVLESLYIERSIYNELPVLRVCSQSLLSFTHVADDSEDLVVVIDAPRLEYMRLDSLRTASFELNNMVSLVKVDIGIVYNLSFGKKFDPNDLPKRNVIRNFLLGISSVKDMIITSSTLEAIYDNSRYQTLPLLRNLSSLRVTFNVYLWEMLPIFLESCPNLKSLVMIYYIYPKKEGISIVSGPRCLLKSLEYVEIKKPLKGKEMEMKLVSYLLENSPILKKLTLWLDDSTVKEEYVILYELLTIPRLSTSCQVVVHQ